MTPSAFCLVLLSSLSVALAQRTFYSDAPLNEAHPKSTQKPHKNYPPSTLEYLFKEGKCLDLESLCLHPASRVWHIRVEVRVLQLEQPQSSAAECASVAVLAALLRFRRPEVRTKKGSERDSPANGNGVPGRKIEKPG